MYTRVWISITYRRFRLFIEPTILYYYVLYRGYGSAKNVRKVSLLQTKKHKKMRQKSKQTETV
jgi:hypothetical protein